MQNDSAMDYRATASYIGCSIAALRQWKRLGKGPSYYKIGKLVRYRQNDVDSWLAKRLIASPEEASA
jgi:predicted DNA-binding transcriptional regulator AlpA